MRQYKGLVPVRLLHLHNILVRMLQMTTHQLLFIKTNLHEQQFYKELDLHLPLKAQCVFTNLVHINEIQQEHIGADRSI